MRKLLLLLLSFNSIISLAQQCIDVDLSFGNSGFLSNTSNITNDLLTVGYDITVLDNGFLNYKVTYNPTNYAIQTYSIKKFFDNGTLDTSFGINGSCQFTTTGTANNFHLRKIVPIGSDYYLLGYQVSNTSFEDIKIYKINSSGIVENGYGPYIFGENEIGIDLVLTGDGKLLVTAQKYSGSWNKIFLLKLNLDGTIDTNYENNGSKEIYVFPQMTIPRKILKTLNNSFIVVSEGYSGSNLKLGLTKLDPNGQLDTSYNTVGSAFFDSGNSERFLQSEIKNDKLHIHVADLVNSTYINNRIVVYDLNSLTILRTISINYTLASYITTFIVYDDESIMVAGKTDYCNACDKNLTLNKYLPNGNIDTTFCSGGSQELNISNANNYNVDDNAAQIYSMGTNKIFLLGSYTMPYVGGGGYMSSLRLIPGTLSTTDFEETKITISPNPAEDILTILINNEISSKATIKCYNSNGQMVKSKKVNFESNSTILNVFDLASDLYFIRIETENGRVYHTKFIKK